MASRWIMHVPVVSLGHIKVDTAQQLQFEDSVNCFNFVDGGFMFWCGDASDNEEEVNTEHQDLNAVLGWARANGSNGWVRLDRDGDLIEGLPVYE